MTDLDVEPEFLAPGEDDDRLIPIDRSHLSRGTCQCGATALVAPGRRPRCGKCLRSDAASAVAPAPVSGLPPLGQGHPPRNTSGRVSFPAPEISSRDEWDGESAPSALAKVAQRIAAAGWRVKVQRSRGCPPNAATGAPGAVRDLYALIVQSPDGKASAYAVRDGATWSSVMLWGATLPWFAIGSISDLTEYVAAGGQMPPEWFDAIRTRIAGAGERAKELASCNRGVHAMKYRSQASDTMSCSRCGNSWLAKGEPWRKARAKKDAAN